MFEWFVIYLLVQVEEIRGFFGFLSHGVYFGVAIVAIRYLVAGIYHIEARGDASEEMHAILTTPTSSAMKKVSLILICVGIFGIFGRAITPTQKNIAIIAASGVVYTAVTSDAGKRLGNKGVQLLEKKIDELLGEDDKITEEEPKKQQIENGKAT